MLNQQNGHNLGKPGSLGRIVQVGKMLSDWLCAISLAYANKSALPTTSTLRVPFLAHSQSVLCPEGLDIIWYSFRNVRSLNICG